MLATPFGGTPPAPEKIPGEDTQRARAMARVAMKAALDRKAKDVVALELRKISLVADYFVLCSGTSATHNQAIAGNIMEEMRAAGYRLLHREGHRRALWILMDYGPVVVHVFREEERRFYDLERLWGDAEVQTLI